MPLVGLIDPSHDGRRRDAPGILPKWYPRDELVDIFVNAPPKFSPWTYELVAAALDQWQDRDYISSTMLVDGCSRSKVLERREDFVVDLDSLWPAFRGTQLHRTLEFYNRPDSLAEARFFTKLFVPRKGEVEISCSPDIVTVRPNAIGDYKAPVQDTSIPSYGYPWPNQTQQLNFNRYIVNHAQRWDLREGDSLPWDPHDLKFERLYIVYLGSRGPKVLEVQKAEKIPNKAGTGEYTRKFPDIWSDGYCEDLLIPRLTGMVKALEAYPEWPDDLGEYPGFEGPAGWACPGKPWCKLPDCLAKRYPNGLIWESPE
jgi:hypothetical protein